MDFIFMLTRHDRTIERCLECLDVIAPLGLQHIGFKDVGVDLDTMRALNRRIQAGGAISYMEVVSTTPERCLASARTAVEIGVNRLLGGTQVEEILGILEGSGIEYHPFPGRPEGHPTMLYGTAKDIAEDTRRFRDMGCAGVDLLAYRAQDAAPIDLVRAARAATDGYLIVAGNVRSPARVGVLAEAGVDAFTVGSAVFDGIFAPGTGDVSTQLAAIQSLCP